MFNFNNTFKNPKPGKLLPKEYVDYLSQNAPPGTKYIASEGGYVVLTPTGEETTISGFFFDPSPEQKSDLGANYTTEDILAYLYNSQQAMRLKLNKPGYITINGKEMPAHEVAYLPRKDIIYGEGVCSAIPEKFPGPFNITISNNLYSRTVEVERKPNRSVHEQLYESAKDSAFSIRYSINDATGLLKMTVNFAFSRAQSVSEVAESMSLIKSWYHGEAMINGQPFQYRLAEGTAVPQNEGAVAFWEKVLAIETILGKHFTLPEKEPNPETIYDVETLYQGLHNKTPTISRSQITSFTSSIEDNTQQTVPLNQEICVELCTTYNTSIFGEEIHIPAIVMVFNALFSKVETKNNTRTVYLADVSDEKKVYTVVLPFKDQDSLNSFPKDDRKEFIEVFRSAKQPSDYF